MTIKNNSNSKYHITPEGLDEFKKEYHQLTCKERPALLAEIADLRSMGDLSENAAYHHSRQKQAFLDGRIKELEEIINNAIIQEKKKGDTISLGSHVTVEIEKEQQNIIIVGESEADLLNQKISIASPLGKALIGQKKGAEILVEAPVGRIKYKILKVK
ncbi:transcription elongation factor GreA [Patescibacteria group bacterium]|nr:transcription elongation factor GreA [Patescibacteria group bacterium]